MSNPLARMAAALIAPVAWMGLGVQFAVSSRGFGLAPLGSTLWLMAGYFTILTNLGIAVLFTGIAVRSGGAWSPRLVAGAALAIGLVGVVYMLLLRGTANLAGWAVVADTLLHMVTPVLVPLYWLAVTPKGRLRWADPLLWALYPLAYLPYALVRGGLAGRYAYPFIDLGRLGWLRTGRNAALIALGFLLVGYAVVWLDHRMGRRGTATGASTRPPGV